MKILDDFDEKRKIDSTNMLQITAAFPDDILDALDCMNNFRLPRKKSVIENIVIAGMGGSAIGGDIIQSFFNETYERPIFVVRDYKLPAFVNERSLVITASYSGETEETLSAFNDALQKKATIVGISSGGTLEQLCKKQNTVYIKIPGGRAPRCATAYMFIPQFVIVSMLCDYNYKKEIENTRKILYDLREKLIADVPANKNPAKKIAMDIYNSFPVIYGNGIIAPIAKRWRTQFNENSKILARDDVFPELNHNDIVGWSGDNFPERFTVILLRDKTEYENLRIKKRIEISKSLVLKKSKKVIEVYAHGNTKLARMLSLMYIGDFVSIYLALLRGIDPYPVEVINKLKEMLGKPKE